MSSIFNDIQKIPYTAPVNSQPLEPAKVQVQEAIPASTVSKSDKVEFSTQKPEKKSIIKTVKGGIANIKKFFASTGAYVKGAAKGVEQGIIAGSVVYTGGSVINSINAKKAGFKHVYMPINQPIADVATKSGGKIKTALSNFIKKFGSKAKEAGAEVATQTATEFKKVPNKALAFVAAGIAIGVNLWNASLNATEKNSEIEHRWTGHKK